MAEFALEILTDDPELSRLAHEYWAHDEDGRFAAKVADLAAKYGLRPSDVAKTVASAAVIRSTTMTCATCGIGRPFMSRADYTQRRSFSRWGREWTCDSCAADVARRRAEAEEALRLEQEDALRGNFGLEEGGTLPVEDMSLEQALALLTVIRVAADEGLTMLQPIAERRLSPFRALDLELVDSLAEARFLQIHPDSDAAAFEWESNYPARYYPSSVRWQTSDGSRSVAVSEAQTAIELALRATWPDHWHSEVGPLWAKLALNECLEYLRVSLEDHGLGKTMGEKTRHVIENALIDFSIGQVYSFIWRAAKDAAAFYLRERVTKSHAANTVVAAIERSAERAVANSWDVKDYRRDRRSPESPIVQLFSVATSLGERYWTEVPRSQVELGTR